MQPLRVFIINQTLHWFIVGLGFPILVLFVLAKGLDIFQAGTVLAVYSACTILLELPTGGLSDSIGRKKVYLLSVAVSILGDVVLIVSWDTLTVAAAAAVMGGARALSSGSMDAWFVDEFKGAHPEGNLQSSLAKAGAMIPMGLGVGSIVGGLLPQILGPSMSGFGLNAYTGNFVVAIGFLMLQFLLTSILVIERRDASWKGGVIKSLKRTPEQVAVSVRFGLKNRTIFALVLATVGLGFGLASVELLWQPRVQQIMDVSKETWVLGVLAAGYFFSASLGNLAATPLCRLAKQRYAIVLALSRVALGACLFLLALQTGILVFALFYFLLLFINGTEDSPHMTMFNQEVPSDYRSTLLSFSSLSLQLGGLAGTLLIGYIANSLSIVFAWELAAVIILLSALPYIYLMKSDRRRFRSKPSPPLDRTT